MLVDHFVAYDDYVKSGVNVLSSSALNERIAAHDTIGLFVVVRQKTGTGGINVYLYHSDDGVHWLIDDQTGFTVDEDPEVWQYLRSSSKPMMRFGRILLQPTGTLAGHVTVHVTARDVLRHDAAVGSAT